MNSTIKAIIEIPMGMHITVRIKFSNYKIEPRHVDNLRRDGKRVKVYDIFKENRSQGTVVGTFDYLNTAMTIDDAFEAIAALQGG